MTWVVLVNPDGTEAMLSHLSGLVPSNWPMSTDGEPMTEVHRFEAGSYEEAAVVYADGHPWGGGDREYMVEPRKVVCGVDGKPALIGRDANGEPEHVYSGGPVSRLDDYRPHAVGYVVCPCGHWHLGVVDARADMERLRCSRCEQRTGVMQPNRPGDVVPLRP